MPKKNGNEPTQKTPAGADIPVPKRGDVFRDLRKVAKPRKEGGREERPEDEPPNR